MRIALFLAAAAIVASPAYARASTNAPMPENSGDAVVFEAGRYHCGVWVAEVTPEGLAAMVVKDCFLIEPGSVIRPELGSIFGCSMTLPVVPGSPVLSIETQWRFPAPGIPHPVTRELSRVSSATDESVAGGDYTWLYRFDLAEEMVEGVWMFEARIDGRAIASCCFSVTSDPGVQSSSPIAACTTPTS